MFKKIRKTMPAVLAAAILVAGTTADAAYANRSRSYCEDYAASVAHGNGNAALMWILPLAAVGAGAGALLGAAVAGVTVAAGAGVGAATGAGVGVVGAGSQHGSTYQQAYRDCRYGQGN
jgi:hypothetical protein